MLFAVNWVYKVLGKTSYYGMDDENVCRDKLTKWLKDDEHAIVLARTVPATADRNVQNCDIKIGPAPANKNKYLQFKFETFYVKDCDVTLDIEESQSSMFYNPNKLASLSCRSKHPDTLYSEEGNNVMLRLQRASLYNNDYNFRINVTTVPDRPTATSSVNLPIVIGGAAGGAIVLILLLFCFFKLLYDRRHKADKRSSVPVVASGDVLCPPRETTAVQVSGADTEEKHPFTPSSQPLLDPPPFTYNVDPGGSVDGTRKYTTEYWDSQQPLPPTYYEAISQPRPQPTAPPLE